jgi:hypothetical protein
MPFVGRLFLFGTGRRTDAGRAGAVHVAYGGRFYGHPRYYGPMRRAPGRWYR